MLHLYSVLELWIKLFVYNLSDCTILPLKLPAVANMFVAMHTGQILWMGLYIIWFGGFCGFWINVKIARLLVFIMKDLGIKPAMKHHEYTWIMQQPPMLVGSICVLLGTVSGYYLYFGASVCFMIGICHIRSRSFWLGIGIGHLWHWLAYYCSLLL